MHRHALGAELLAVNNFKVQAEISAVIARVFLSVTGIAEAVMVAGVRFRGQVVAFFAAFVPFAVTGVGDKAVVVVFDASVT